LLFRLVARPRDRWVARSFSSSVPRSIHSSSCSRNQQANTTLDSGTAAQNLDAEGGSSAEASNRNQLGNYIVREMTNNFRFEHRLSVDESIVRTFASNPASTMINNGVEHVLRCVAKHWRNMLYQENGNFAHQRMEQLNPLETLRFHMPIVLSVLATLRGRNVWDTTTLGPFVKRWSVSIPKRSKGATTKVILRMQTTNWT
jgi:hypothetical protein